MPTIKLEDVSLHYEETGQGTPLLLIHGLGASSDYWDLMLPSLTTQHRVIMVDVRGHGRSDKPAGAYSVPLFAKDVAALCDRLGLKNLHVLGHSMGGMIAFQLVVDRPELVRSLIILNSGPDMVPRKLSMFLALKLRLFLLRAFGPAKLAAVLAKKLFPKPDQESLRQRVRDSLGKNDPDVYLRSTRALIGWTVQARIGEIACPVLVLASDRDYTPLSAKEEYVKLLRDVRLEVITDSGHAASLDQPQQVVEKVVAFTRSVDKKD